MAKEIVYYHNNCADGFASAVVHYIESGKEAEYIPFEYNKASVDVAKALASDDIVFLDCCPDAGTLAILLAKAKSVTIIDHHETAIAILDQFSTFDYSNLTKVFSDEVSGCKLAYQFYDQSELDCSKAVELISDRDTWQFKMHESKAFHAAIMMQVRSIEVWADIFASPYMIQQLIAQGQSVLQFQSDAVENIAKDRYMGTIEGVPVFFVNCPYQFRSYVGDFIVKEYAELEGNPFAVALFTVMGTKVFYSLRSDKRVNCAKIAEKFGGGGHAGAAGFELPARVSHLWQDTGMTELFVPKADAL